VNEPLVLDGTHVRLEPLSLAHHAPLLAVALDPELWRWTTSRVEKPEDLRRYIEVALLEREQGRSIPFATVERASGRVIGSTRFAHIEPAHRRVEIGWTWIGRPWQRSAINTEAKYLMLRHAFESWGCHRVELKTNTLNEKSRRAILRIGGVEEGTLRKHQITEQGVTRDTVYFSILDTEWPAVKIRLEEMMRMSRAS
jgi:RimJ/RimL family protein N-acetyltransferase